MATQAVYDIGNKKVSDLELDDRIFDATVKPSFFYDAVRAHYGFPTKRDCLFEE